VKVTLDGYEISIGYGTVVIFDKDGTLENSEAVNLLKYLKAEGFIVSEQVFLEIIDGSEDSKR